MANHKPIPAEEKAKRANAKRQAVAMMEHQGMSPRPETLADIDMYVAGLMTEKELLARSDARVAAMPNSYPSTTDRS